LKTQRETSITLNELVNNSDVKKRSVTYDNVPKITRMNDIEKWFVNTLIYVAKSDRVLKSKHFNGVIVEDLFSVYKITVTFETVELLSFFQTKEQSLFHHLYRNFDSKSIHLNASYRSHPNLVECIQDANHKIKITQIKKNINHAKITQLLTAEGIPEKIYNSISIYYEYTSAKEYTTVCYVGFDDENSTEFFMGILDTKGLQNSKLLTKNSIFFT